MNFKVENLFILRRNKRLVALMILIEKRQILQQSHLELQTLKDFYFIPAAANNSALKRLKSCSAY